MTEDTPRLRLFAGPNGSGKSTIKSLLRPELLGIYINPDEIQASLVSGQGLDLQVYAVSAQEYQVMAFLRSAPVLKGCQ